MNTLKRISLLVMILMLTGCIWKGEDTMDEGKAALSFESFDGGGPEYSLVLDSDIVACECKTAYAKADHEELTGAGYTVTYTFTGRKPGETTMTVEERSPIAENLDRLYSVRVDEALHVTVELLSVSDVSP